MNWARWCKLLTINTDLEDESNCLKTGELHALILSILYQVEPDSMIDFSKPQSFTLSNEEISCEELGTKLLKFFGTCQAIDYTSDFRFTWPIAGSPVHTISSERMVRVTLASNRAFHCLLLSKDWKFLRNNALCSKEMETSTIKKVRLFTPLAKFLLKDTRWHIMRLENASFASVEITSIDEYCLIIGRGTRRQLMNLRIFFKQTYLKSKKYLAGSLRINNSAYFIANSSLLYCQNVYSQHSKIAFEDYMGPISPLHQFSRPSRVISSQNGEDETHLWIGVFKKAVKVRFFQQLETLLLQPDEKIGLSTYFGIFYLLNVGECFKTHQVSLLDLSIAHGRGRRRKERNASPIFDSEADLHRNESPKALKSEAPEPKRSQPPPSILSSFWNTIMNWKCPGSFDATMGYLSRIFTNLGYTYRNGR